jgi:hypothetical protein
VNVFRTALALAAGALASTALGFLLGWAWLFPVLGAAVPYPLFIRRVAAARYRAAVGWVLLWTVFQSLSVGGGVLLFPERAAVTVHRGPPYAREMIHWVRTGEGEEGSPRLYLPIHLRHYAAFCVLSVLTAGAASLVLGTWLLNYMNYYVASLVRASVDHTTAALLGWPLWAEIRVVGYVITGAALAALGLSLFRRWVGRGRPPGNGRDRETRVRFPVRVFLLGLGLVVLDAVLKAVLAPFWQPVLLKALLGG